MPDPKPLKNSLPRSTPRSPPGIARALARPSIAIWHVVIGGFQQHEGRANGMLRLWWELHRAHAADDCAVIFKDWNFDRANFAERIWRLRCNGGPTICIYAYSWGGMSAVRLADELGARGLRVRHIVLADPVYRHWYPLGWWRSFCPWAHFARILVPGTVDEVTWFRQAENWPRAHQIAPIDPDATWIHNAVKVKAQHRYMDDAPAFHAASMKVAEGVA